ncbi:glycosyltransferase [Alicyclobacillus suci]|uniref:glycosyltransferase n=1 Tax=Alicyclobacillus suci TaxID=2816080 RepID=UPI001A8CE777|nr:glycosyltransferase [Alicyclobacillus suci]
MGKTVVVHVIESASGGSLEYLRAIVNGLSNDTYDQVVIYSRRPDTPKNIASMFNDTTSLIEIRMTREISMFSDISSSLKLRRLLKSLRPDIVHLHSSKAGALGRIACVGLEPKVVYTPHGFSFFRRDISCVLRTGYFIVEFALQALLRKNLLVGSLYELTVASKFTRKSKLMLIRNAVNDIGANFKIEKEWDCVIVGRITRAKNPQRLVNIAKLLQRVRSDLRILWVGDGELRGFIEEQATKQNLKLTITGWVPHEKVERYLQRSRIYIQTSDWEAAPLAVLEAMSAGLPVIASKIPAHQDIIRDGHNGFLADSVESFVHYIKLLLDDASLCQCLGLSARMDVIRNHNINQFLDRIHTYYQCLLSTTMYSIEG